MAATCNGNSDSASEAQDSCFVDNFEIKSSVDSDCCHELAAISLSLPLALAVPSCLLLEQGGRVRPLLSEYNPDLAAQTYNTAQS
jgi:hypothetical protein